MEISNSIIKVLNEIEKEHAEFFKNKSMADHIAGGIFMSGYFINPELPSEIMQKIHRAFDDFGKRRPYKTGRFTA